MGRLYPTRYSIIPLKIAFYFQRYHKHIQTHTHTCDTVSGVPAHMVVRHGKQGG